MFYRNLLTKEKLNQLYFKEGNSFNDIARKFNCSGSFIGQLFHKYHLKPRSRNKAMILSSPKNIFRCPREKSKKLLPTLESTEKIEALTYIVNKTKKGCGYVFF